MPIQLELWTDLRGDHSLVELLDPPYDGQRGSVVRSLSMEEYDLAVSQGCFEPAEYDEEQEEWYHDD